MNEKTTQKTPIEQAKNHILHVEFEIKHCWYRTNLPHPIVLLKKLVEQQEALVDTIQQCFDGFPTKEGTYREYVKSVNEWLEKTRKNVSVLLGVEAKKSE